MARIGAVVEQPKFTPTFTGRKNLTLLARTVGAPTSAVDAALAQVGLDGRDRERFKGYSLGMKQRLAIAATLLKSPDLLILDEPTNGLDPAGIRDIRDMIRSLGESGVTVLLSSHILAEVQQVCHSVSIIGQGRMLASGPVEDLVSEKAVSTFTLEVADPLAAARVLARARYRVDREGDRLRVEAPDGSRGDVGEAISRTLAEQGLYPRALLPVQADLESVFLRLTAGEGLSTPDGQGRDDQPRDEPAADDNRRRRGRCGMRLVRVELSRFRSRRAVALLLVAAALLTALIAGATLWNTRPITPSELASARAQVAAQLSSPEFARELKSCRTDPEQYLGPDADASGCEQALTPMPESYLDRSPLSPGGAARLERPGRGGDPGRADDHHRGDVRRRRLGHRVDEQPDALRAPPGPGLAGQGRRRAGRLHGGRGRPAGRVLAGALPGRGGARHPHRRAGAGADPRDGAAQRGARRRSPAWAGTP